MAKPPINPWLSGLSCTLCVAALMTWAEAKSESSRDRRKKPARVRACPASPNGPVDPPADGATPVVTNVRPTYRRESGANASRRRPKKSIVSRRVGRKVGKAELAPRDELPQGWELTNLLGRGLSRSGRTGRFARSKVRCHEASPNLRRSLPRPRQRRL